MRTYTNVVLTIIAGCLLWLCAVATWPRLVATANAYGVINIEPVYIPSGGTAQITGPDASEYVWDDGGSGGKFLPDNTVQNPQYIAPVNTGTENLFVPIELDYKLGGSWYHAGTGVAILPAGQIFADVPSDYWACSEIEQCYAAGVVQGYPDGKYHPEDYVTRAQMACYVSRALAAAAAQ